MKPGDLWECYGWVKRGRQRRAVIRELRDKPTSPQEFRRKLNSGSSQLSLREVSRHFTTFTEKGLMKCITPKEPYGRLYVLTDKGRRVQEEVSKEE